MAKIKYDVSDVEDVAEGTHAPVGIYRAKVRSVEGPKQSSGGNPMLEVVFDLTHDAQGKKLTDSFMPVWYYPILEHEHPFVQARWKEFLLAFGLKPKGTLDTDKIVGQTVQLKLKSDTDQDGEYRPKISKVMALAPDAEPAEEEEPEEPEDEEPEGEEEDLDLDSLSRAELKALIKEEELEIKVVKSMTDDAIREAIAACYEEDEGEEEPEEEEPEEDAEGEEEEEGDGYDDMSVADLKAELKERELATNGARAVLIKRLRKDDQEEPF